MGVIDSFHLHTCKRPWANTETRDYFLPCSLQLSPKPFQNPKKPLRLVVVVVVVVVVLLLLHHSLDPTSPRSITQALTNSKIDGEEEEEEVEREVVRIKRRKKGYWEALHHLSQVLSQKHWKMHKNNNNNKEEYKFRESKNKTKAYM